MDAWRIMDSVARMDNTRYASWNVPHAACSLGIRSLQSHGLLVTQGPCSVTLL